MHTQKTTKDPKLTYSGTVKFKKGDGWRRGKINGIWNRVNTSRSKWEKDNEEKWTDLDYFCGLSVGCMDENQKKMENINRRWPLVGNYNDSVNLGLDYRWRATLRLDSSIFTAIFLSSRAS